MAHRLAVSTGDPAGIGLEVVLKAAHDPRLAEHALVLVGDEALIRGAGQRLGLPVPWPTVTSAAALPSGTCLFSPGAVAAPLTELFLARPSAASGRAAAAAVRVALELVKAGHADALVTAPLNKEALGLAGEPYPGHTELLATELAAPSTRMMLAGGPLRVALVTTHIALRDVAAALTLEGVRDTILTTSEALERDFGIAAPRIAVSALNPHASDGGRFGDEEARILIPAIEAARRAGAHVTGPHPADTLFAKAARADAGIDAVVAMYHDQGLIPVKLAAFGLCVNVTLGIPIVRTSPDHGTAYDIAGQGIADADSFVHAVLVADGIVAARRQAAGKNRR
jgi:4-hydroxythreonine-4-phosphate dehydrogenase